ncbi:Mannosyl oligosaccharide glucosidase [Pseudobythopirellula maris]|uniref:Mannosyl oligosaccharide glucosidase n=1 Tax=Pseudobythopirellula maris TaxID=2527991 RepID=A0A5C5ZMY4_9BACT|nr:glucosidase [Pseudobythopirellula maris]TWT88211.1 Mannosyl oligosaccharide glucosidase [Pseudobythopirellula maris]
MTQTTLPADSPPLHDTVEHRRLRDSKQRKADWKHWGPYVADRAWGTVREDYSPDGEAWDYFRHDHARSRAYRWNEDGLAGVCNRYQNAAMALAVWNEKDEILKERLFGLSGPEGNHGEDVKEYYYYLDSTPSHSYMRMLYRYPQAAYPYAELVDASRGRSKLKPEHELIDQLRDCFAEKRYFDVVVEYAKATPEDLLCRITVTNHGPEAAPIHVLPHIWFRNTWSWGYDAARPMLKASGDRRIEVKERHLGKRHWAVDASSVELMFTENETNRRIHAGDPNASPYSKDSIHAAVVEGDRDRLNPARRGTKAAAHCRFELAPGESQVMRTRFSPSMGEAPFADFDKVFSRRQGEADDFYDAIQGPVASEDDRRVQRQAYAGLLWTKQFYHFSTDLWLAGDPSQPPVAEERKKGRNSDWPHAYHLDVISMPDKWEYPWFAAWDLAFHTLPLAQIDPEWAKRQLVLLLREWYMHPNGQIPAYEWNFSDVNPPVHAWACWRVYKIARKVTGRTDTAFLEEVFHKLLLNFTWWVNRKDSSGQNVFQGGFLGLDNIGVFDRSKPIGHLGVLEQADGTGWMGMYCLNMLAIALELARYNRAYEPIATKFLEHFVYIADAINNELSGTGLWSETDGFYYDALRYPDGDSHRLRIKSFVGLIPLFAVETIEPDLLERLPDFRRRMEWFIRYRPEVVDALPSIVAPGNGNRRLLSLVNKSRLERVLGRMFDPNQFLSPYGLRSLSKEHEQHPFRFEYDGEEQQVGYEPAESGSYLFGGNSNWRGPVWFPTNYLMIESLQKFHHYYGDAVRVKVGDTGATCNLEQAAGDLSERLIDLFRTKEGGRRPVLGDESLMQGDPDWTDHVPFYEYFHGDTGKGLGASHQTGWTALVAKLIQQTSEHPESHRRGQK